MGKCREENERNGQKRRKSSGVKRSERKKLNVVNVLGRK